MSTISIAFVRTIGRDNCRKNHLTRRRAPWCHVNARCALKISIRAKPTRTRLVNVPMNTKRNLVQDEWKSVVVLVDSTKTKSKRTQSQCLQQTRQTFTPISIQKHSSCHCNPRGHGGKRRSTLKNPVRPPHGPKCCFHFAKRRRLA